MRQSPEDCKGDSSQSAVLRLCPRIRSGHGMSFFAMTVMKGFLAAAGINADDPRTEEVSWDEVAKIFFDGAPHIRQQAISSGRVWPPDAPDRLDSKLFELALTGRYDGVAGISPDLAEELWRRWTWAIIGATAEAEMGQRPFDLHLPRAADPAARGWAVVLFVLLGPARDYRPEAIPR